ncbi:MAG: GerMN domain-containing protein [Treponema sp.]|nr:GerMN domain-containing protein [Treponema sp.]
MSEKEKGKKKKKTGLGIAIWILLFLIILIVFLVKQEEIKENFDKSGATALIEKKIGKDIFENKSDSNNSKKSEGSEEIIIDVTKNLRKTETVSKPENVRDSSIDSLPQNDKNNKSPALSQSEKTTPTSQSEKTAANSQTNKAVSSSQNDKSVSSSQNDKSASLSQNEKSTSTSQVTKSPSSSQVNKTASSVVTAPKNDKTVSVPQNTMKTKVCFVAIDSDGPVVRKEVTRTVEKDSPMGDALKMLLAGPSSNEEKTGCRTLIPEGTRLLSASVKNGIAILNFSEEFQFNQFGAEGSLAQLMQVVYTATNFSTVKGVQILIEGQKRDYLTEGVWIGSPLTRNNF